MQPLTTQKHMSTRLPRRLAVVVMALFIGLPWGAEPVQAGGWMFRRSYFSHALPPGAPVEYPLPNSRSAYRSAYVGNKPGFSVYGAYRINRIRIRSGNSVDTTILRENRFEIRP